MRMAECHPDKRYHCKNLCTVCYGKFNQKRWASRAGNKEKAVLRSKQWELDNSERSKFNHQSKHLKRKYGISLDDYTIMFNAQEGKCKLCNNYETLKVKTITKKLAVDHDHRTGKIRALLCFRCNTSIALIENNPKLLNKIKSYLGV